jgi:serine/threonine protein kinase
MTGDTGSPRYMAPEVALLQPYNETADVYSFAILLWQMLAMMTPFANFTMSLFHKSVVKGGARPKNDPKWPVNITALLNQAWNTIISKRPSMEEISAALREEINSKSDEEVNDILDISRKSEMSMHIHKSNIR